MIGPSSPVVCGIVPSADRTGLLLFRRSNRPGVAFPGMWCLPGGKAEEGETLLDAAVREVAEETSLRVKAIRFVGEIAFARPVVPNPLTIAYFLVSAYEGTPCACEAGTLAMFVPWADLPRLPLTPGSLAVLSFGIATSPILLPPAPVPPAPTVRFP